MNTEDGVFDFMDKNTRSSVRVITKENEECSACFQEAAIVGCLMFPLAQVNLCGSCLLILGREFSEAAAKTLSPSRPIVTTETIGSYEN